MSFATRIAAGGKKPVYILEFDGDEISPANFDAIANWSEFTVDVTDLAVDTADAKSGTGSIGWNKTGTGNVGGRIDLAISPALDLSKHRYFTTNVKAPTTTAGTPEALRILLLSGADFYRWIIPAAFFTAGAWHKLYLSTSEISSEYTLREMSGTPNLAAVDGFSANWRGTAAAYTFTGARVDALRGHPYRYSTGPIVSPVADTRQGWMDTPNASASRYDPTGGTLSASTLSALVVDDDGSSVIEDLDLFPMVRRQVTAKMGFLGDAETDENFEPIFRGVVDVLEHVGRAWSLQCGDLLRLFRRPFMQAATKAVPVTITGNIVDVFLKLATSTGNGTNRGDLAANYDTETAAAGAGISADLFSPDIEDVRDDWMPLDTCSFTFRSSQPSLLDWFLKEVCFAFGVFPLITGDGRLSIRAVEAGVYPSTDAVTLGIDNLITDKLPGYSEDAERIKNQIRILYDYDGVDDEFDSDTADTYQLTESVARYGVQELTIESKGLVSASVVERVAKRYSRMLGDGAPPIELQAFASQQPRVGGELVHITLPRTMPDIEAGTYGMSERLAQIESRSFDPASGRCSLRTGMTSYRRGRYRLIAPSGTADYDSQTATVKATYCSISDGTSLGTDGDPEHEIGP